MAKLLFKLRGVPDDETEEVRALLTANGIEHYETPAGNWGISMPAIWLHDDSRLEEARALLETYQHERQRRMRGEFERMRREGTHPTLLGKLKEDPLHVIISLAVVALVVYVSVRLVLELASP